MFAFVKIQHEKNYQYCSYRHYSSSFIGIWLYVVAPEFNCA